MQTFEVEHRTFDLARARLVRESDGKFVVIRGSDIGPAVESFQAALRWGYSHFDIGSFCVKQVASQDPVIHMSERSNLCED